MGIALGPHLRLPLVALGVLVAAAMACLVRIDRPLPVQSETLFVFGTLVELVFYDVTPQAARDAAAVLEEDFQRYHRNWHAWESGELGNLNAAISRGEALDVSPELALLLDQGKSLSLASGGLFDPSIGRLIALWGFHDDGPPEGPPPRSEAIDALLVARPSMADLQIRGTRVSSPNRAIQLDLGAFAKGAALDLAAETLVRIGIQDAVLNAGGDINVIGRHGARDWRVAIRDPFGWGAVAALTMKPGEVVYTSGNYERFLEQDGERFSHILDPRTGWPVRDIVSATVLGRNGARADAAATALSVAGPRDWAKVAREMGVEAALLIDSEGRLLATPAMAARLERVPGSDWDALLVSVPEPAAPSR